MENSDLLIFRGAGEELELMLKKMGGDPVSGNYKDGRDTYHSSFRDMGYKIRYVCDIPAEDQ